MVYVSSGYGDHSVYALDAATGTKLWSWVYPGFPAAPVVANGVVYVDSPSGAIVALGASAGRRLWRYHAAGSVYSSPAVANGMVYVASSQGSVIAFGL